MLRFTFIGVIAAAVMAFPALSQTIEVEDPYARSASPMAGAAFMILRNTGDADDRLVEARSDAAQRVELHTHIEEDGLMRMVHVEEGFVLPAGAELHLRRGAEHVMFMGLVAPWEQGDALSVTLVFEQAGEVVVEIPVDLERQDMGHGGMDHGSDSN